MIKIKTLEVAGIGPAIHAMRNPYDSWEKSDTHHGSIGAKDRELSERLSNAGPEHAKHLRMCMVWAEIEAPLYWWKQFSTYRMGVESLSCSTMHTLMNRPFEISDFSFEMLPGYKNEVKQFIPEIDEESEIWKDWNDYKVSNQGRIIGKRGRIISGTKHKDGYLFAYINGKQVPYHRIIAECFCEGYDEQKTVNHIDGNKLNNHAENLEWVTQSENIKHSYETHLQPKPTKTYSGKFTSTEREEIKKLWDNGMMSKREIAKKFGVSHTCINDIISDKYRYAEKENLFRNIAMPTVDRLNELRDAWIECENADEKKLLWETIISMLPEGYNQRRTVMMSYAALRQICSQRKGHKLDEWHKFREWAFGLPEGWMIGTKEGDAQ